MIPMAIESPVKNRHVLIGENDHREYWESVYQENLRDLHN
jgi:hypothetical protein